MCAVVYLLPDVGEGIHEVEHAIGSDYPVSFVFIVIGYLLLLFLEHVLTEHTHEHHHQPSNESMMAHHGPTEDDYLINAVESPNKKIISSIFFGLMIGMHAIIEAIIVGVQKNTGQAFAILFAILSHKWVESMSLGILMYRSKVSRLAYFCIIFAFSLVAPIGVGIGVLVRSKMSVLATQFFNGLAAGTFIYLGTTEIIAEEFSHSSKHRLRRFLKFACILLGGLLVCVLRIWIKHSHGDDHDHGHPHPHPHAHI